MVKKALKLDSSAKIVQLGIERYEVKKSVKEISSNISNYLMDDIVQRSFCWDSKRKSLLVHSILAGIPIPQVFAKKEGKARYNILDGKQRLSSIIDYISNSYALSKYTPPVRVMIETDEGIVEQEINIGNKKFKQLPEQFQDKILSFHFNIECMEMGDDDNIKSIVFDRLNNNKPLRPVEKIRASMEMTFLEWLGKTKTHPVFNFGETELRNGKNEEWLLHSILLLKHQGDTGIGKKEIELLAKTGIDQTEKEYIEEVLEYINKTLLFIPDAAEYKRILFRASKVSAFLYVASIAMNNGVEPYKFSKWAVKYFAYEDGFEEFQELTTNGANKRDKVSIRLKMAEKNMMNYTS